jgi:hypothetical protein
MNAEERERQRLQRLRDAQIRSRDPGPSKIQHYDWSRQKAAPKPRPLLAELLDLLPTRIRGFLIGLFLGLVIVIIVGYLAPGAEVVGLIGLLLTTIVGYVLGSVVQSQE